MEKPPKLPHRRSIRLREFDYSQTADYFVTIVTHERLAYFGVIDSKGMSLSKAGRIIESVWPGLEDRFPQVTVAEHVVMPNHFHGIISISTEDGKGSPCLGDVIGAFKSISTRDCILAVRKGEMPPFSGKIWQRNYYEHIIRDAREWEMIAAYIAGNPDGWVEDEENPYKGKFLT